MTFSFASPAISAECIDGWWFIRREGKGDWLRFRAPRGGLLYLTKDMEPVGNIYADNGPTSEASPSFGYETLRPCECGKDTIREYRRFDFDTPSEAVEEAAFFFLS